MARKPAFDTEDVLHQTMIIFWERGYEGTSIRDISDKVQVKPQGLYNKFGNKEKLFLESLKSYNQVFDNQLLELEKQDKSPKELLSDILVMNWADHGLPEGCMVVDLIGEVKNLSDEIKKAVQTVFVSYQDSIKRVLKRAHVSDGQIKKITPILLMFHNGLQVDMYDKNDDFLRQVARDEIDMILGEYK